MSPSREFSSGRMLHRAQPTTGVEGELIQVASANLNTDRSTAVIVPIFSTLLTGTITTVEPASFLDLLFYCSFDYTGLSSTLASVFRLRLDGTLIPPSRAADDSKPSGLEQAVAINRRVSVVAGMHTIDVEWSRIDPGTLQCFPATRPDEHGAHLIMEEQRT